MSTTTDTPQGMDELDWSGYRARYFPESHRHDLKAIAAYGAYKHNPGPTHEANQADTTEAENQAATDTWEGEGGASYAHDPVERRSA